ncbi:L-serine ammonia-lyase, iron-sulfur-dependent, subunit alpha [Duncaniella freteri]|uniref:L-cysteine desulfidase family protein n=1 Tax=Duncaniella freteri TaxID=2530391 RepID=UPI0025781A9D|nr:L-serine ammonia-lyase, iron-sulfur-dependent, subunit alpha [Duncaniella freteri]
MLPEKKRKQIIDLMNREVVPAMGCTEPIAVALCAAKCAEVLGKTPDKIILHLSANILKNAMGVGIPGTGMIGLPIAIALGVTIGKSEYNLEVIRDVNPEAVKAGQRYIDEKRISINLKTGITEKLYIEAESFDTEGNSAVAVISGGHTNFIKIARNGETILDNTTSSATSHTCDDEELDLHTVYEFATTTPIDELKFILEAKKLNKSIAEHSFGQKYGHAVGRTLNCERQRKIMGDSAFARILSYTTAACDARMAGAPIPVMSNSGSGNQGIAATMPVVVYAEENNASEEQTIRALVLSHLTAIYIKQSLGKLSALCGCVVATTGSACGICYLMGGEFEQIAATTKNMIANLTGMICDGAKPSCAMKLSSGVSTAVISALMAMEGHCVTSVEGIVDEDVDKSIHNLTHIGRDGMNETDRLILEIMTSKH